jgi:hypothetical protein
MVKTQGKRNFLKKVKQITQCISIAHVGHSVFPKTDDHKVLFCLAFKSSYRFNGGGALIEPIRCTAPVLRDFIFG